MILVLELGLPELLVNARNALSYNSPRPKLCYILLLNSKLSTRRSDMSSPTTPRMSSAQSQTSILADVEEYHVGPLFEVLFFLRLRLGAERRDGGKAESDFGGEDERNPFFQISS